MRIQITSFLKVMLFIPLIFISTIAFSQNTDHIIFEATSPKVTIRKYSTETKKMEDFLAYYSPKHNKILLDKTDFEMYPDSKYYLVKARFKMFNVKGFNDDPEREETHIQIHYYYLKTNSTSSKVEEFGIWRNLGASYYPGLESVKDVIQKDQGGIRFIIDDNTQWYLQNTGKSDDAIFYIDENKVLPHLTYVLMITNLKWLVVNGIKVNG